mgnify:CR=1 FL=1
MKIFLKIHNAEKAKKLFSTLYHSLDLPFFDEYGNIIGHRKMRAYLVKDEGVLQNLAQQKFDEEL